MTRSHDSALAFDFDGTLIHGGKLNNDKSIHIMYASWVACREHGLENYLRPRRLSWDVAEMTRAYIRYPGAPRFQQLAAIVNALVNRRYQAVADFEGFGLDESLRQPYQDVRAHYNQLYSALNDAAAEKYWKPYPSVKKTLRDMARRYDLYIASGVTQDILEKDFARHRFDPKLFQAIQGGNVKGGSDKGEILKSIKEKGYQHLTFVADSNKDLEYAQWAAVPFYRIREDSDYLKLPQALERGLPAIRPWAFTAQELRFMKSSTLHLLERYLLGQPLTPAQATRWINR